jgi:hypothetical protein
MVDHAVLEDELVTTWVCNPTESRPWFIVWAEKVRLIPRMPSRLRAPKAVAEARRTGRRESLIVTSLKGRAVGCVRGP